VAVNQKQIAEKLGVSITLVSRVLSEKAAEIGIADETIKRVLETAKQMGYVPSAAALSLKGKATRTIGVAVYDFNDPFFGTVIQQIQVQANEHNYSLVLAGFLHRTPDEQDLQSLHKHAIDGLIIIGSDADAQWVSRFSHLPIARIGHGSAQENSVRITIDEDHAAFQLLEYLNGIGRKEIICISGKLPAHQLRQRALKNVAQTVGLEFYAIQSAENDAYTIGRNLVRQFAEISPRADTLVCATDQIALGAIHALYEIGITVPEDIAVTGFDDIPVSSQVIPTITTLRQPLQAMVKEAFSSVIEHAPPCEIALKTSLIIRQSS